MEARAGIIEHGAPLCIYTGAGLAAALLLEHLYSAMVATAP
jgi:hypothetical protein